MTAHPVMAALCEAKDGVYVHVHAQPGARRVTVRGMHGDAIKVSIREAAEGGKANAAIVRLFAELLDVPRRDVELVSGQSSRRKRLFIHGESQALMHALKRLLEAA